MASPRADFQPAGTVYAICAIQPGNMAGIREKTDDDIRDNCIVAEFEEVEDSYVDPQHSDEGRAMPNPAPRDVCRRLLRLRRTSNFGIPEEAAIGVGCLETDAPKEATSGAAPRWPASEPKAAGFGWKGMF